MPLGLYLSVPFCRTKCSFCNFASDVFSKPAYENYVTRLLDEIAGSRRLASEMDCALDQTADSIYLGGGTPSILDSAQLLRIFAALRAEFTITSDAEITVECAPGTLTPALIETLLHCGVNRISLGVQSFVDREAQSVGRLHSRSIVLEEIGRLHEAGLANLNIDLIAGLPHQTAASWAFSVSETIATGVPHVSVYMLEVDDDSRLGRELIAGGARYHAHFVPNEDATADFYEHACQTLAAAGVAQYEISNFARVETGDNNQSRHNLKYWTRQPYVGFGVDAHSMLDGLVRGPAPSRACPERSRRLQGERSSAVARSHNNSKPAMAATGCRQAVRFATPDSLDAYMNRAPHMVATVTRQAAVEESFFLGLRLNCGIDLDRLRSEFGPDIVASAAIEQSVQDGLLEQQGTTLRLTARGRLLSNEVFARLIAGKGEGTKVGTVNVNPR
jgi:oxygen-independent coproporphyrinogen-3 oxidase